MPHPTVTACREAVEQAQSQSAKLDRGLERSDADMGEILASSREAVARSRRTLARLREPREAAARLRPRSS